MGRTSKKIIITGPGRSGTTFLMQLFEDLGYDTGVGTVKEEWRAGFEWDKVDFTKTVPEIKRQLKKAPRFLKSPELSLFLKKVVGNGALEIEHMIVPVRDLREAAVSRLSVGLNYLSDDNLDNQHRIHGMMLGFCVEAAVLFNIPMTVLQFPRLVQDGDYLYKGLKRIFPELKKSDFNKSFKKIAKPEKIQTKSL